VIGADLSRWLVAVRTLDEVHGVRVEHAAVTLPARRIRQAGSRRRSSPYEWSP
jgi:hypothetical protein